MFPLLSCVFYKLSVSAICDYHYYHINVNRVQSEFILIHRT